MIQSKEELENWYDQFDRWGYFENKDDAKRLQNIMQLIGDNKYDKAIDIGCGEGFITQHLPANLIYGLDLSNNALNRLPSNVIGVNEPEGTYNLVVSTGTLYEQYDHEAIYNMIIKSAQSHILIGGIKEWLIDYNFGKIISTIEFPYREFTQKVTLYEFSLSS